MRRLEFNRCKVQAHKTETSRSADHPGTREGLSETCPNYPSLEAVKGNVIITNVHERAPNIPVNADLSQNYPTPFNPTTVIGYLFPSAGVVILKVYDIRSREIETLVDQQQGAGVHNAIFDGSKMPSGIYFFKIQAGTFVTEKEWFS